MVDLCFPIVVGIEHPVINQPELVGMGVEIDAVNHPDAFNNTMRVTPVLPTHQLDFVTIFFI